MAGEQLLKGVLDILVLGVAMRGESYGYDIVQQLRDNGLKDVGEASVYGTLRRLEQQDWLTSRIVSSDQGPDRRYYRVTKLGRRAHESLLWKWDQIASVVDAVARPEGNG